MKQPLNKKGRPFSWSYSRWNDFNNCPYKYAQASFYCTLPYVQSPAAIWGDRVHKAAEMFLKHHPHDDAEALKPVRPYCEKMVRSGCPIEAELEIVLNRDLAPIRDWYSKKAWLRVKIDVVLAKTKNKLNIYDWKGLALDTKLPSPDGWTTMGEVEVGDVLFGSDGQSCKVVGKSEVFHKRCFHMVFKDGAEVVCDADHLWPTEWAGKPFNEYIPRSTDHIFELVGSGKGVYMPLASAAQYQKAQSPPIHPYVLGCWIGDGRAAGGEISKPNEQLFLEIEQCGYKVGADTSNEDRCTTKTIYGLRTQLIANGLYKNKHIPNQYLTAPYRERVDLLQGLMDTDGTWNPIRKQCVFTTTDLKLATDIAELIASLGMRPYVAKDLKKHGFEKHILAHDIAFTPTSINPFRASRHNLPVAVFVSAGVSNKSHRRYIKSITEIPSVPTQCIEVNSTDNTFLCTDRYVVTHNTGKMKHDDEQVKINALALSCIRPEIEEYSGLYVWLKDKKVSHPTIITKRDIPLLWEEWMARVSRMEEAWASENFPQRPSGLCGWCNVVGCKSRAREYKP